MWAAGCRIGNSTSAGIRPSARTPPRASDVGGSASIPACSCLIVPEHRRIAETAWSGAWWLTDRAAASARKRYATMAVRISGPALEAHPLAVSSQHRHAVSVSAVRHGKPAARKDRVGLGAILFKCGRWMTPAACHGPWPPSGLALYSPGGAPALDVGPGACRCRPFCRDRTIRPWSRIATLDPTLTGRSAPVAPGRPGRWSACPHVPGAR
jgi:hypothetical protein